jgi:hypothetical protein
MLPPRCKNVEHIMRKPPCTLEKTRGKQRFLMESWEGEMTFYRLY